MAKFKVGDQVKIKNTIAARIHNPNAIGKTGKIVRLGLWWYDVRVRGQKGIWEAHKGELKKVK